MWFVVDIWVHGAPSEAGSSPGPLRVSGLVLAPQCHQVNSTMCFGSSSHYLDLTRRRSAQLCTFSTSMFDSSDPRWFVFAGLTTEGLYRVSGNKTDQDNIQKQFDQGETHLHHAQQHRLINTQLQTPRRRSTCVSGVSKRPAPALLIISTDRDPE